MLVCYEKKMLEIDQGVIELCIFNHDIKHDINFNIKVQSLPFSYKIFVIDFMGNFSQDGCRGAEA